MRLAFGLLRIASQDVLFVQTIIMEYHGEWEKEISFHTYTLASRCNSIASICTSAYVYYSLVNPPPFLTMAHSEQSMEYSNKEHLASSLKQAQIIILLPCVSKPFLLLLLLLLLCYYY